MVRTVVLNACHTSGGGGLVYLQNVLPYLARAVDTTWIVVLNPSVKNSLNVPETMQVFWAPEKLGFWRGHAWEQLVLPFLQKKWGAQQMLCNANYGPLLARGVVPIIHTTPRAAGAATGVKMFLYWRVLKLLTRVSVWRAGRVASVARHVLKDYGGAALLRKTVVAPPGAPEPVAAGDKNPNLVVAVGDFYAQKNYPLLMEAFARLLKERPDTRLEIIGRKVDGAEVVRVETEMVRWGISRAITMAGGMPHVQLLKRLAEATVLVNVSKAECFNMPLLEAMAVGTPVVCGDVEFQREVVGEAGSGQAAVLVKMDDGNVADAVAVALFGVLENPPIAKQLREAGRRRAAQFTWEQTAAALLAALGGPSA